MLEQLLHFIRSTTSVLYTVIYQNRFFFIDYWSFNHFVTGALLTALFRYRGVTHPLLWLLGLLCLWETVEITFVYLAIHVFKPEIIPDQFTDIVIGMLGGVIMLGGLRLWKSGARAKLPRMNRRTAGQLALAATMSGLWVASYSYRYNVSYLNSPLINWWAFAWWTLGIYLSIRLYEKSRQAIPRPWFRFLITWVTFLACLLAFEFTGYNLLGIREIRGGEPLIFGLVHGTRELKIYYLVAVPIAIAANRLAPCAPFLRDIVRRFAKREITSAHIPTERQESSEAA